jgi:hypothetical protein
VQTPRRSADAGPFEERRRAARLETRRRPSGFEKKHFEVLAKKHSWCESRLPKGVAGNLLLANPGAYGRQSALNSRRLAT